MPVDKYLSVIQSRKQLRVPGPRRKPPMPTASRHRLDVPRRGTGCWPAVAGQEARVHEAALAAWEPQGSPVLWFWKEAGTLLQASSLRTGPATLGGSRGPGDTAIQAWRGWAPFRDLQSVSQFWQRKGWLPQQGSVSPGPSGVLDVLDVPEGCLIQDATHLLQSLCLANPLQAYLCGWVGDRESPAEETAPA